MIEWQIFIVLFRTSGHVTQEEASSEQLRVLNGILDYCEGWKKIPRKHIEEPIRKICYVSDLKHLDSIGIRKAELAAWTFMNRFSRIPDFIRYPDERKTSDTDISEE